MSSIVQLFLFWVANPTVILVVAGRSDHIKLDDMVSALSALLYPPENALMSTLGLNQRTPLG